MVKQHESKEARRIIATITTTIDHSDNTSEQTMEHDAIDDAVVWETLLGFNPHIEIHVQIIRDTSSILHKYTAKKLLARSSVQARADLLKPNKT